MGFFDNLVKGGTPPLVREHHLCLPPVLGKGAVITFPVALSSDKQDQF